MSSRGATKATPGKRVQHPSSDERAARGRAARSAAPRGRHASLEPPGRDALALLAEQDVARLQDLVPLRYGRMMASPFAFFRGAAVVMAHDLASTPRSGLTVQLCGDAHLANFGGFASPERAMLFDLNDFDETLPGPFEWDVKRLAASFEIAGRHRGLDAPARRATVLRVVRVYRETMRTFAAQRNLDVWYARLDVESLQADLVRRREHRQAHALERATAKARTKDSVKAFTRLAETVDGEVRIASAPPLVQPSRELLPDQADRDAFEEGLHHLFRSYRETLQGDRRQLLESFRVVDIALKVVGVGSVGTRCWIVLLLGRDDQDPLFLQVKEAGPSVLERHLERSRFANHGQRVVEGQRLMQASSDIFLGFVHAERGLDGRARDFYVRQLWDWKASADLETIEPEGLDAYARACGWTLARAHARSGDRVAVAAYLGRGDTFDRAVAEFASAYAEQNERDHAALVEAVRAGDVAATPGI